VTLGIIVPLLALPVALLLAYAWYRRRIAALHSETQTRPITGSRLTSEALRRLPQPPWRIVIEIAPTSLEGVDHVAIGPGGVVSIFTVVADRPTIDVERDPFTIGPGSLASRSIARSVVGAAIDHVGVAALTPVTVYWGAPHPELPAARRRSDGAIDVEGQRLTEWLTSGPTDVLSPAQVDACWQAIVTAIGRPDPLP
jgi:hypothetical protein